MWSLTILGLWYCSIVSLSKLAYSLSSLYHFSGKKIRKYSFQTMWKWTILNWTGPTAEMIKVGVVTIDVSSIGKSWELYAGSHRGHTVYCRKPIILPKLVLFFGTFLEFLGLPSITCDPQMNKIFYVTNYIEIEQLFSRTILSGSKKCPDWGILLQSSFSMENARNYT